MLAIVALAGWALACAHEPQRPQRTARPGPAAPLRLVGAGEVISGRIAGSAAHGYAVAVPAGRLLHLVVEQQGVDLVVTLGRPGRPPLLAVDSPNRDWGPEELWWIAPESGVWQVDVRPLSFVAERPYRLRVLAIGPPSEDDRRRAAAQEAIARADRLGSAGDGWAARAELLTALALWQGGREPHQEALTELRLAEASLAAGEDAVAWYRRSLAGFRRLGDRRQEVLVQLRLGEALRQGGDLRGAQSAQEAALALARRNGLLKDEAAALNNLGLVLEARGDLRTAFERYRQALAVFRRLGARESTATALHNLGVCASQLGRLESAQQALTEGLALRRDLGDVRGEAATLTELGWTHRLQALIGGGERSRQQARALLQRALALRRAARDTAGEAGTLDRLGTVLREERRWDEALACYQGSLALVRRQPPGRDLAHGLTNLAGLLLDRGDLAGARRLAAEAVTHFSRLPARDPQGEAYARLLLGRAEAGIGDSASARREIERALEMFEALRAGLGDETLTLPFFALRQLYFDGAIDALMGLEARRPHQGLAAAALVVSERARMRTLVDGIAERERRDRPERREHRQGVPEVASAITVEQIQRELLDGETLFLELSVGEERGFLWIVDRGGLTAHPLPGRRVLAPLVRRVYSSLAGSRPDPEAGQRLAALLLGRLEDRREIRRLVLVTDGPLAYVPFAALPWGPQGRPLVERFELVRLPSAATLLALRRRQAAAAQGEGSAQGPAGPVAAVLADPVFSAFDPRIHDRDATPASTEVAEPSEPSDRADLTRSVRALRLDDLPRLPATRREAEAIAALAPRSFVALDFAARRDFFDRAAVQRAGLLHLATHSLAHPTDPVLSGIVLSLVDTRGRPRPGFLRASEIAALDLHSRLVVLSACETALGPEVRGEGLLGLSRAFLHAGASGVVASLWNVADDASATLMARFYEGLLRDRLPPATALRRAQLALRADPRTADPALWAGFELQGDWR